MKVLVVDDDVVSRMVLMHLIDASGDVEIVEAEDGQDAWEQIERGLRPAICFCDLRMPRLSGMDLLKRVKHEAELATMPFVLVSSATDRDTVGQAASLGADGYIVKPFQADQVRAHLAGLSPSSFSEREAAESPQATMRRLAINADRLLVYLGGFQCQVTAASAEMAELLANGLDAEVRIRIERLHAGCVTLGLNGAASALAGLASAPLDGAALQRALADAVRAVLHQSETIKRLHAPV